jgi:hypothetical protein
MTLRSFLAAAAVSALMVASAPASAQIAAALGRPLPVSSDPTGAVTVRVVVGDPSTPANGIDVTLAVNGTPRVARTDASGRATFVGIPANAASIVKIAGTDGELASQPFPMPATGGVRILMSTTGSFGGQGGATESAPEGAAAGGAAPSPRQRSGGVISNAGAPADTLGIRVSYDDLSDPAPPKDQPVYLVAYGSDEKIVVSKQMTDAEGRVKFAGLDVSGATSYFAMTTLPRGSTFDRLLAGPIMLPGGAGVAMVLSAEKRTSTAPAVDDLFALQRIESAALPAGRVVVELQGGPERTGTVTLHNASDGSQLGSQPIGEPAIDPAAVTAKDTFSKRGDIPAKSLDLVVVGPDGTALDAIDVAVQLASETASPFALGAATTLMGKTSSSGPLRLGNLPVGQLVAVAKISGKEVRSAPFEVSSSGGVVRFEAEWPRAWPAATFDTSAIPVGTMVYAESTMGKHSNRYRSLPFQLVSDRGARTNLLVLPRVMFQFSITSAFDEDYFVFRGRFAFSNNSWFPFKESDDGLLVPLPVGFKGAQVGEEDANEISPIPGSGLRILRPLAPGVKQFISGWSMSTKDGEVKWDMGLPFGVYQSGMEIMQLPGVTVDLPPGVQGRTVNVAKGAFLVVPEISILPGQRMVMTIRGLPAGPLWKLWAPRAAGGAVILILLVGLFLATRRGNATGAEQADSVSAARAVQTRIDALMNELVALDGSSDDARRAEVMAQLEKLWPSGKASASAATADSDTAAAGKPS